MTAPVDRLRAILPELSEPDRKFAASMLRNVGMFGTPTEKQAYWIEKLVAQHDHPPAAPAPTKLGSFAKVYALFAKAKQTLRYPKVRLQVEAGLPVVLSTAGERSSQPGVINVTDGGPYGANKWYGRVLPDGTWNPGRHEHPELPKVAALLQRLGDAPEATAAEYGAPDRVLLLLRAPAHQRAVDRRRLWPDLRREVRPRRRVPRSQARAARLTDSSRLPARQASGIARQPLP